MGLPIRIDPDRLGAPEPPPPNVRAFHPDDLHITLAFFGPIEEARARSAFEAMDPLVLPSRAAVLGEVVALGNRRRPSAISALVACEPAVIRVLGAARDALLAAAGCPEDRRDVLPHVTVARLGRAADDAARHAALAWAIRRSFPGAEVRYRNVALFGWSEDRRARLFRVLLERPLGGGDGATPSER